MLTIHNLTKMAGAEDTTAATEEDAAEATAELEGAKLTEAQTEMVKTLFKVWDFNGDGVISSARSTPPPSRSAARPGLRRL